MVTVFTIVTIIARHVMRNEDPVAGLIFFHALACLNNLPGDFMSQHKRRFFEAVPLKHIGPADA